MRADAAAPTVRLSAAAHPASAFDPGLGYAPGSPRIADETDVIDRMLRGGFKGSWVPGSKITHFVTADRLTWKRIRLHHVMQGAGDAFLIERSPDQNWLKDREAAVLKMSALGIRARAIRHHASFLLWQLGGQHGRAACAIARSGYFAGMTQYWEERRSTA